VQMDEDNLRARIAYAQSVRTDIDRFKSMFPPLNGTQTSLPPLSWEELERQLSFLAVSPEARAAVPGRISAFRRLAPYKPPEMVLQEILVEAWLLLDAPRTDPGCEEASMS
jgi:hypothetical protein